MLARVVVRRRVPGDRGSVTVEAAIALCALVTVVALVIAGLGAVGTQLRCTDAATQAARVLARGAPTAEAERLVGALAPGGATMTVRRGGNAVVVRVSVDAAGGLLPGVTLRAEAHAQWEPGVTRGDAHAAARR
ncbi:hypothetical protein B1813_12080 [Saccharomonospora piscinae]|uniref:TadE-like protein n=1 Tax=Saccharomonospora piscinae TaxID=687388 RepID=A0A1V9A6X4_SACPI|nr:TadE family type IV pilus minor pilin [Saccharomonospora piscinae]OQO92862.1 hypothetical protein B1813_12080 [Saccharomonospora piscinae]